MELRLSCKIYSKEAVLKTSYMIKEHFSTKIDKENENYVLHISPINGEIFNESEFISNLNEQQLREELNKEFGTLRDKIYEKAFSVMEQ